MKMNVSIKANIQTAQILKERGLGSSNAAAKHLAGVVRTLCDPYVPMQQGTLKNTAQVISDGADVYVLYNQPYANYQYTGEIYGPNIPIKDKATGVILGWFSKPKQAKYPTGRPLSYNQAPQRGKEWDKRMMADRGDEVGQALADYVGGEYKK